MLGMETGNLALESNFSQAVPLTFPASDQEPLPSKRPLASNSNQSSSRNFRW